jgi:hypothetical protein
MNEKTVGYILLSAGVLVIALAAISVLLVFTKNVQPVQLFNFQGVSLDLSSVVPQLPGTKPSAAKTEILPSNVLNDSSNVFAHLFLMGFIANIGGRIATLGVQLLRPVEVKVRTKEVPVNQ